jgi:arylsulfatase A-like enzyme
MKKKNILFLFTDDQRFDTINTLGNSQIQTPNLDKLTETGTVFTHAHIPGGTCGAVCMPSRAMLHSGRTLFRIEREGQNIPPEHITIGEHFRKNGYNTFGIGKWHNGRDAFARSFSAGDEIFFGGMTDHWNVPAYRFDPEGKYDRKSPFISNPFAGNKVEYRNCDHIDAGKHSTDLFTETAVDFLNNCNSDSRPFFLYISLMAPHDPRTMPEKFRNMYNQNDIKLPENFLPEHPVDTGALRIRDELLAAFPRTPQEIRRHIAEYYAMITHLDFRLGQVIDALKQNGLYENTVIVFAGDNGLAVGQHGLMGKQNLYDHSVRVPLIFSCPDIPSGLRSDALVYLSDIFPALCSITGTEIPESVEGKDISVCFTKPDAVMHNYLYLAYAGSIRGITDGNYKLIEYACGETQLFDLSADPYEINNIAEKNSYRQILQKLRGSLTAEAQVNGDMLHPTGSQFWNARTDLKNFQNDN